MEYYEPECPPFYISEQTRKQIKGIVRTTEMTMTYYLYEMGESVEERSYTEDFPYLVLEPWLLVDKDVYTLLHKHYPRMQFAPVFLKKENE